MKGKATYVYCLVSAPRRPSVPPKLKGLPSSGAVRLIGLAGNDARSGRTTTREWLVVGDAPLDEYGEAALNASLGDLDWVSSVAVAHEAVVEHFLPSATALLPMKLFTIFLDDRRALDHLRRNRETIDNVLNRVKGHEEWGVRVTLERGAATLRDKSQPAPASGAGYLTRKKALRDRAAELASRARDQVGRLYDELAGMAGDARRRPASELPAATGPLLLDAAFLVPRRGVKTFQSTVKTMARTLAASGYHVALTGPWPPYNFLKD